MLSCDNFNLRVKFQFSVNVADQAPFPLDLVSYKEAQLDETDGWYEQRRWPLFEMTTLADYLEIFVHFVVPADNIFL